MLLAGAAMLSQNQYMHNEAAVTVGVLRVK